MYIVGIDPGLDGAVAIMNSGTGLIEIVDTPTSTYKSGKKNKRMFMAQEMADILIPPAMGVGTQVFIEQVSAMPGQGVTSMFGFGKGYGIWIGICAALKLSTTFVTPQRWKKDIMAGIPDKTAARIRAQQLFPSVAPALKLVKHDGRAEALLIAEYGRRSLGLQYKQKELPLKKR